MNRKNLVRSLVAASLLAIGTGAFAQADNSNSASDPTYYGSWYYWNPRASVGHGRSLDVSRLRDAALVRLRSDRDVSRPGVLRQLGVLRHAARPVDHRDGHDHAARLHGAAGREALTDSTVKVLRVSAAFGRRSYFRRTPPPPPLPPPPLPPPLPSPSLPRFSREP